MKVESKIKQNKVMFMISGSGHLKRGEGKSEIGWECSKKILPQLIMMPLH